MRRRSPDPDLLVPGRGRTLSRDGLAALWAAVTTPGPKGDRVRYGVLEAVLVLGLALWGGGLLVLQVTAGPPVGAGSVGVSIPASAAAAARENLPTAGRGATGGLRTDLFRRPGPARQAAPAKPKTNPVALLELIELQGVLGGSRPRAMVTFKRTGEAVTVSVGDDLGEFKVMEIRERSVVLKWREELFELSL